MTLNYLDGTPSGRGGTTRIALLALVCTLTVVALGLATSAAGEDVALDQVSYEALDADGDGFDDGVRVNATVHNTDQVQTRAFAIEVQLEHASTRVDLRTTDDLLAPNATVNVTVVVSTGVLSPITNYTVRVLLHAMDLTGEVVDNDETSIDLHPVGDYSVDVQADPTSRETLENTTVYFTLTVGSGSNNPTGILITVDTTLGWTFELEEDQVTLEPDTTTQVGLTVHVPPNAPAGAREVLVVEVVSTRDPIAFTTTSVSVRVAQQVFDLAMTLSTTEIFVASGRPVTIEGTVTNAGNNVDNVTLLADVPGGWTAEFEPPHLLLPRGTTGTFTLDLAPPDGLGESGTRVMNVTALSQGLIEEAVVAVTVVYNTAELRVAEDGLSLTPAMPASGDQVTLQVTVMNGGSVTVNDLLVVVQADGEELARTFVDEVRPGGLSVATLKWTATPGSRLLRVTLDPEDDVPETDDDNNVATMTISVTSPDLSVTISDITMDPNYPTEGEDATVGLTVHNLAQQLAGPFDVELSVGGEVLRTFTVDAGLGGGANVTLTATWTAMPGRHEFTVAVDVLEEVAEVDRTNNGASRSFSVNRRPTASLVIHMTEVEVGEAVEMRAEGSSDPDGRVRQYFFDYGDGTDSGWVFTPTSNHTYGQDGSFQVRLYVRDEAGAQNEEPSVVDLQVSKVDDGDGDGNGTPSLPAPAVLLALLAVALLSAALSRRGKG